MNRINRIAEAFKGKKAFIPFVTAGMPDLETTFRMVLELVRRGADLIELGIPFSDPTAEGPVIMKADLEALKAGTTTDSVFELTRRLRQEIQVPIVYMTYANVVFSYGTERFMEKAAAAGADGLILPDVPYEEQEEFRPACRKNGMALISMIAPTSRDRISRIAGEAEGFLYIVSSLGVTGIRSEIRTDIQTMVEQVRQYSEIPCAVGFGISEPDQAAEMAAESDGVIVGSAIMKQMEENREDPVKAAADFAEVLAKAVHEVVS